MLSLRRAGMIFWDFDGVIKESVDIKTQAFGRLFQSYGTEIVERVCNHHEAHGGMSRFDKIPLYLAWAGEVATPERVDEFCRRFAQLTRQGVIDAPWVPGAEAFLRNNPYKQRFVLVTATPQQEIEEILAALHLHVCFAAVYGAPVSKKEAIREALATWKMSPQHCHAIGDAGADFDAAQANQVPFLLRRHGSNGRVFKQYTGDSVEDFTTL